MTTKIDDFSEGTGDDVLELLLTDLLLKISPLLLLTLAQRKKKGKRSLSTAMITLKNGKPALQTFRLLCSSPVTKSNF